VGHHVLGEDVECATHETDGAVWVSTRTAPVHLDESVPESCHEVLISLTPSESSQVVGNGRKSQDARSALTGTLPSQISGDACGFGNATGILAKDGDHSDSRRSANEAEWNGSVGSFEAFGTDPVPAVAAHE
jgi:hypothetical protein